MSLFIKENWNLHKAVDDTTQNCGKISLVSSKIYVLVQENNKNKSHIFSDSCSYVEQIRDYTLNK